MENNENKNVIKTILIDIISHIEDDDPKLYDILGYALSCASCDSKN